MVGHTKKELVTTTVDDDRSFVSIDNGLMIEMSDLTLNAWKLFMLLLRNIVRRKDRSPTRRSNPFKLTYRDYIQYGLPRESFNRGIKELMKRGYIQVWGDQRNKKCRLTMW